MIENKKQFDWYLITLLLLSVFAGFFYSQEFGFLSSNFILSSIIYFTAIILGRRVINPDEKEKKRGGEDEKN